VRRAVEFYTIDILKAFDRINHHGVFLKLMQRKVPVNYTEKLYRRYTEGTHNRLAEGLSRPVKSNNVDSTLLTKQT